MPHFAAKRNPVDRAVHRQRTRPGRRYEVWPDPASPLKVEVWVIRDRRRLREAVNYREGAAAARELCLQTQGLCRSYTNHITGQPVIRPGGVVARIWFNERDLREHPGELVAHECGHAAMAWSRLRCANLGRMAGEEVMCYALGRLVQQVTNTLHRAGHF